MTSDGKTSMKRPFFSASNVELLAKLLDGRAVNGNFWVLWGGMTNVGVTLRVTDTLRGSTRTYTNPVGSHCAALHASLQ
jgi:hypothetical protein